ncbi:MAG: TetR/AcrR family transcriptional regulator, partial [Pseudomonadota bacterium]
PGAAAAQAASNSAPGWGRLDAALRAFIGYYLTRPDDLALGFYLTGAGIGRRGLSKTLDAELNAKLMAALAELERGFLEIGVTDPAARRVEMTSAFAGGAGALMLLHTGRLSLLGVGVDAIVARQLAALRALHRGAEPDGAEAG